MELNFLILVTEVHYKIHIKYSAIPSLNKPGPLLNAKSVKFSFGRVKGSSI